ncbi:preprotein translocase subunit SecE [Candidatus Kaiserbacteria bacterium]|nr:MAG: preprotein translocase subunit SecE [Candidatus Kaiserbacteria bacterium]
MGRLIQYVRDTRAEMKHVSWPTQRQTGIFTVLVILVSAVVASFLGVFDTLFSGLLNKII